MHPYLFTLNLLKETVEKAPAAFPKARRAEMFARHKELLADANVPLKEIEDAVIEFGRAIWPYRQAYQELHDDFGRDEPYMVEKLKPATRAVYETFRKKGGNINDIRAGRVFEEAFSPEEKHEIEEALLQAREAAHKELDKLLANEKKEAFVELLTKYSVKQESIEKKIAALKALAAKSSKWSAEILDKVKTFEQGWSGVEREVTEEDVKGEIEYYEGIIEI